MSSSVATKIRAKRKELDALRPQAAQFRGPCVRCVHFEDNDWLPGYCRHPLVQTLELNPVSGDLVNTADPVGAEEARKPDGFCGPDGFYFIPATWWSRYGAAVLGWCLFLGLIALCILGAASHSSH